MISLITPPYHFPQNSVHSRERVDSFSAVCGECQALRQHLTKLAEDLRDSVQVSDMVQMPKERRKSYLKTINNTIKHLQREHHLITEGQNFGIWLASGAGIGVALGTGMGNVASGIPFGIGLGMAIGAALDTKARKEGLFARRALQIPLDYQRLL